MTRDVVINFLRGGAVLAISIPASSSDRLAWVGVYPLDLARETTRELLKNHGQEIPPLHVSPYRIRRFEVDRILIEKDASIAEPELQNKSNYFAFGEDDLFAKLKELGVSVEKLVPSYKSDYPI